MAAAEAELARRQAARPRTLTAAERAAVLALGDDLGAVWDAPSTSDKDRKQLLRTLLEEVNITIRRDHDTGHADLILRWKGGAISDLAIAVKRTPQRRLRTSEDTIDLVRQGLPLRAATFFGRLRLVAGYLDHRDRHPGVGADADPLFTGPNHSRLTRSGVAKLLARHVRAVRAREPGWAPGLPVTPHTLRRSRAMHLVQAGVNLIYIRDLLGHADVSTTEIYARADAEAKRRAIENAYEPLTPDALPDWTSDSSLLSWLDSLGR